MSQKAKFLIDESMREFFKFLSEIEKEAGVEIPTVIFQKERSWDSPLSQKPLLECKMRKT